MTAGAELRAWRIANGYPSARALADALGLHPSIVQMWENNQRPVPAQRRARLAELLPLTVPPSFKQRRIAPRPWLAAEVDRLRELAGKYLLPEVTAILNAEFPDARPRTEDAVRSACYHRQIDPVVAGMLSVQDVAALFHAHDEMVPRRWVAPGLLVAHRYANRQMHKLWIDPADLRRFIEQCSWAYDWQKMPPSHWRSLAEVVARRDCWRTRQELAAYLGASGEHDAWWWRRNCDWIPHQRRYHNCHSTGQVLIRAADFPAIKEGLRQRKVILKVCPRRRAA